jgi:hypothetical protein
VAEQVEAPAEPPEVPVEEEAPAQPADPSAEQ